MMKNRTKSFIFNGIIIISLILIVGSLFLGCDKKDQTINDNSINYHQEALADVVADLPDAKAMDFLFSTIDGYWVCQPNQFFAIRKDKGKYCIEYGYYQSGYWVMGYIIDAVEVGENTMELTIQIPAKPETEMDGAQPERIEAFYIDVSTYSLDNRLSAKSESLQDAGWYSYEFGGKTLQEAFAN